MSRIAALIIGLVVVVGLLILFLGKNDPHQVRPANEQPIALANMSTGWHQYTAPDKSFTVKVPSLPHHATDTFQEAKTKEKLKYELYVSANPSGSMYTISVIVLPKDKAKKYDESYVKDYLNQLFSNNPKNKINTLSTNTARQGKVVEFSVDNEEVNIEGKAFVNDNTLYVLSVTTRNAQKDSTESANFFDSFQWIPANEKK